MESPDERLKRLDESLQSALDQADEVAAPATTDFEKMLIEQELVNPEFDEAVRTAIDEARGQAAPYLARVAHVFRNYDAGEQVLTEVYEAPDDIPLDSDDSTNQ